MSINGRVSWLPSLWQYRPIFMVRTLQKLLFKRLSLRFFCIIYLQYNNMRTVQCTRVMQQNDTVDNADHDAARKSCTHRVLDPMSSTDISSRYTARRLDAIRRFVRDAVDFRLNANPRDWIRRMARATNREEPEQEVLNVYVRRAFRVFATNRLDSFFWFFFFVYFYQNVFTHTVGSH